jgi:rhomboid family GlyGly-CTERM serine protease
MNLAALFEYDRAAILHGEVWRLITGHFVHWSWSHLAWDLLAFVVLGAICMRRRALFVAVVLATALVVSLFLLLCCPEVAQYRGLSAIDSALWMWAVFIVGERRVWLALTLLSLFVAKLMIESTGIALFVSGATLFPVVHLLGAFIGFCGSAAEHRMRPFTDAALHRAGRRDRVRRRRDESAVVGGAA